MGKIHDQAYVTLATNDSYALGALVLGYSLKDVGTKRELAVIITPMVTAAMRSHLNSVFDYVACVDVLESHDSANLALIKRPELGVTFTKINCWKLTNYNKCVFLDSDCLVIRNCDELFERDELSAAPDIGWPDCFNSGVFVFVPSNETFKAVLNLALSHGSFDGGDQGLLNTFFSSWATKDINKHLSFIYNMASSATYSYLSAYKRFMNDVKIIHFLGPSKPWNVTFNYSTGKVCTTGPDPYRIEHLQKWWDIYMKHVHAMLDPTFKSHLMGEATHHGAPPPKQLSDQEHKDAWEGGKIDYMGADAFENIQRHIESQVKHIDKNSPPHVQVVIGSQIEPKSFAGTVEDNKGFLSRGVSDFSGTSPVLSLNTVDKNSPFMGGVSTVTTGTLNNNNSNNTISPLSPTNDNNNDLYSTTPPIIENDYNESPVSTKSLTEDTSVTTHLTTNITTSDTKLPDNLNLIYNQGDDDNLKSFERLSNSPDLHLFRAIPLIKHGTNELRHVPEFTVPPEVKNTFKFVEEQEPILSGEIHGITKPTVKHISLFKDPKIEDAQSQQLTLNKVSSASHATISHPKFADIEVTSYDLSDQPETITKYHVPFTTESMDILQTTDNVAAQLASLDSMQKRQGHSTQEVTDVNDPRYQYLPVKEREKILQALKIRERERFQSETQYDSTLKNIGKPPLVKQDSLTAVSFSVSVKNRDGREIARKTLNMDYKSAPLYVSSKGSPTTSTTAISSDQKHPSSHTPITELPTHVILEKGYVRSGYVMVPPSTSSPVPQNLVETKITGAMTAKKFTEKQVIPMELPATTKTSTIEIIPFEASSSSSPAFLVSPKSTTESFKPSTSTASKTTSSQHHHTESKKKSKKQNKKNSKSPANSDATSSQSGVLKNIGKLFGK